jgi:hypothetical protein
MSTQSLPETQHPEEDRHGLPHVGAGVVLVTIGLLMFVGQFIHSDVVDTSFILVLGLVLLFWGCATRHPGPIIAGGIVSGIGLGTALTVAGWPTTTSEEAQGAVFLLAFALGWGSIPVLTALFTPHMHWWPLLPGGVLAFVGVSLLLGEFGTQMLIALGTGWPVLLVAVGLYLLWRGWAPAQAARRGPQSVR